MPSGQFSFYLHYPLTEPNICIWSHIHFIIINVHWRWSTDKNHKTCGCCCCCCGNCICDMCSVRYAPHTISLHSEFHTSSVREWEGARLAKPTKRKQLKNNKNPAAHTLKRAQSHRTRNQREAKHQSEQNWISSFGFRNRIHVCVSTTKMIC